MSKADHPDAAHCGLQIDQLRAGLMEILNTTYELASARVMKDLEQAYAGYQMDRRSVISAEWLAEPNRLLGLLAVAIGNEGAGYPNSDTVRREAIQLAAFALLLADTAAEADKQEDDWAPDDPEEPDWSELNELDPASYGGGSGGGGFADEPPF
jgi:hypothetical protein